MWTTGIKKDEKIMYKVIPHSEQLYNTCGNWDDDGNITVSETGSDKKNACIAIHEFTEYLLCKIYRLTDKEVTAFDTSFTGDGEPGAAKDAPYREYHLFAELIERLFAHEVGVDWEEYEKVVNSL